MICRDCIAEEIYIEEHATLYALFVKYTKELCPDKALEASTRGTILYGTERGMRMAKRTLADGRELTPENYLLYCEWADHLSWGASRVGALSPVYRTQNTRCGWYDSWRRQGLLEYGALYCKLIDQTLVHAYNPDNELDLPATLSNGDGVCDFGWIGVSFENEAQLEAFRQRQKELRPRAVKDFLYHCGHMLSAMHRGNVEVLGEDAAAEIREQVLDDFNFRFRPSKTEAIEAESKLDFTLAE